MLKAITLPAPEVVPPIVLLKAPLPMSTPSVPLPRAAVPLTSVPMKLPCTRFPVSVLGNALPMTTPSKPLPEIRLPVIVLLEALPTMATPSNLLRRAVAPLTSVPMKLPSTRFLVLLPWMWIPEPAPDGPPDDVKPLPEIKLRAPGVGPPMVLLLAPLTSVNPMSTPKEPLPRPRAAVPVTLVPMKLPWTTLFVAPDPVIATPPPPKRLITSPSTVLPPPVIVRPVTPSAVLAPFSSMSSTASSPLASEFCLAPGWV